MFFEIIGINIVEEGHVEYALEGFGFLVWEEQLLKIGEKVYKLYPTLGQATKVAKDEEISMLYSEIQDLEKKLSDLNIQLNNLDTD